MTFIGQRLDTDAQVYGGCQDNGNLRFWGEPAWFEAPQGDGGGIAIDSNDEYRVMRQYVRAGSFWKGLYRPVAPELSTLDGHRRRRLGQLDRSQLPANHRSERPRASRPPSKLRAARPGSMHLLRRHPRESPPQWPLSARTGSGSRRTGARHGTHCRRIPIHTPSAVGRAPRRTRSGAPCSRWNSPAGRGSSRRRHRWSHGLT